MAVCVHAPACMCSHLRVHRDLSLHKQSWPVKRSAYVDRVTYSKDKHQTYTYPGTGFFFCQQRDTGRGPCLCSALPFYHERSNVHNHENMIVFGKIKIR